jgi:hypothetical protein
MHTTKPRLGKAFKTSSILKHMHIITNYKMLIVVLYRQCSKHHMKLTEFSSWNSNEILHCQSSYAFWPFKFILFLKTIVALQLFECKDKWQFYFNFWLNIKIKKNIKTYKSSQNTYEIKIIFWKLWNSFFIQFFFPNISLL